MARNPTDDGRGARGPQPNKPTTLESVNHAREQITRQRILDAARVVAAERGYFRTEIGHILEAANTSRSTLYRYFPDGKPQILRILTVTVRDESEGIMPRLLNIEDGAERIVAWMEHGFDQAERYGVLVMEIGAGNVPPYVQDILENVDLLYRFIGRAVKDCQEQGHCKDGIDVRHVVHTYFALIAPEHFLRRRADGRTAEEIMKETQKVFFGAFAKEPFV